MFTLIKEEVNSTFLPFDKFIDHRCCERVLSVFKPSAGQTEQRRFKPQINFRPSLSLFFSGILGAAPDLTCCYIKDQHVFGSVGCFWLSWMFFPTVSSLYFADKLAPPPICPGRASSIYTRPPFFAATRIISSLLSIIWFYVFQRNLQSLTISF